jgi:hypothetical protein
MYSLKWIAMSSEPGRNRSKLLTLADDKDGKVQMISPCSS